MEQHRSQAENESKMDLIESSRMQHTGRETLLSGPSMLGQSS